MTEEQRKFIEETKKMLDEAYSEALKDSLILLDEAFIKVAYDDPIPEKEAILPSLFIKDEE